MIERLAESLGSSRSSVREDLWPTLLAIHDSDLGGSEDDFTVAKRIGLSGEDHLAIHGIPKTSKVGKSILEAFGKSDDLSDLEEVVFEEQEPTSDDDTQSTLDSFG